MPAWRRPVQRLSVLPKPLASVSQKNMRPVERRRETSVGRSPSGVEQAVEDRVRADRSELILSVSRRFRRLVVGVAFGRTMESSFLKTGLLAISSMLARSLAFCRGQQTDSKWTE